MKWVKEVNFTVFMACRTKAIKITKRFNAFTAFCHSCELLFIVTIWSVKKLVVDFFPTKSRTLLNLWKDVEFTAVSSGHNKSFAVFFRPVSKFVFFLFFKA